MSSDLYHPTYDSPSLSETSQMFRDKYLRYTKSHVKPAAADTLFKESPPPAIFEQFDFGRDELISKPHRLR